jgi:CIC family chloride channel protein
MSFLDRSRGRGPAGGGSSAASGGTILSPPGDEETGGRAPTPAERALGDFTISLRSVWPVLVLSVFVGAVAAGVALALLDLIGMITHIAYYGTFGWSLVQPTLHHLGWLTIFVPVAGGLIIGAMAYWGSERIRGHGIPEAMETILVGGSKIQPRLAVLKPVSSAVSIGTGGPFGAEGPIILTGGAFGSVIGQYFRLSASQRRTLLVAGACGGMAAVFGTPVAAALFGIELLAFEWKPRSMVPIGISVGVAEIFRDVLAAHHLILAAPLFPVPPHGAFSSVSVIAAAAIGIACGLLAWTLTGAVYGAEDLFRKLPIHWAWWPAIGGIIIGAGGLVDPRALGVGYSVIDSELSGKIAIGGLVTLLIVKLVIWSMGLGSGTSGGILAPLLLMGAALGGIMAPVMPGGSSATWALLGMAGALAGVTRSPFTAIIFAFELTHDTGSLLPLLVTCTIAHLISTLVLKRSILTEKVARRGFHVMREYQVEPMEALFVREAMERDLLTVAPDQSLADVAAKLAASPASRRQRLYPVIDGDNTLLGVIAPSDLLAADGNSAARAARNIMHADALVTYPDEILRGAADRMAEHWVGALPVVTRDGKRLLGVLTEFDLLKARQRQMEEERHRERVLRLRRVDAPAPQETTPDRGTNTPSPDATAAAAAGSAEPAAPADGPPGNGQPDPVRPGPDGPAPEPDQAATPSPARPAPDGSARTPELSARGPAEAGPAGCLAGALIFPAGGCRAAGRRALARKLPGSRTGGSAGRGEGTAADGPGRPGAPRAPARRSRWRPGRL